jgi:hypothetical protein
MFVFCLGAFSFVQTISCLQTIFNHSLSCYCSVYTIVTIARRSSDSLNYFSRALFTTVSLFHALYTRGCHSSVLLRNRCRGLIYVWLGFFFTSLISLSLYFRICRACVKYKNTLSIHVVKTFETNYSTSILILFELDLYVSNLLNNTA